ncbi:DUF885 domain-containing protein [Algibacillus agarilyticus]|uniref:DUF885 domain-containing protein n=1 Tax=Algibacillus agarilyticus TaxID=2234133 RepID=UPI000DD017AE|nr:DUF885 domain-containing protein [Algibacillus agarilyticus]
MKYKIGIVAAGLSLLTACDQAPKTATEQTAAKAQLTSPQNKLANESEKVKQLFEQIFEEQVARSPMSQAYLGRKTQNDKWDNLSADYQAQTHALIKQQLIRLNNINKTKLDKETLVSYHMLHQQLSNDIADHQWRLHDYPVNQMFGAHSDIPALLINQHRIDSLTDAEAYIARLNAVPVYFKQLIEGLKARAEAGIIPPKFVFEHVIRTSENIIKGSPITTGEDNPIYADFKQKIDKLLTHKQHIEKQTLLAKTELALTESVQPAYKTFISYIKQLEKQANNLDGVWKLPRGNDFYNVMLQRTTTTDLTAQEIHKIGLSEVTRIHNEMNVIKDKVGFKGDLNAFMQFMRTDKQFYYPNDEAGKARYLAEATDLIDTMKTKLDALFITKPKAKLTVKAVEPFREQAAGKAFYQQPAEDGSRPGIYYANLYDMSAMPTYQMAALAYHEGLPGHHMQLALSQEIQDMPKFRRYAMYTAYIEGWGLYSEYIPKEIGFYQDPYSDFGRLAMELWRACRLVVDTGIHAMQWTRAQGIEYYENNTPNAKSDAVKMVERHIVMPSQATAYKVGMLEILSLREKAKTTLGAKFDIREFHEVVLQNGPVPLNILGDNIDEWIRSKS